MAIKKYWNFADEVSVPADFTSVVGGAGAVSISSGHLRIDNGGTASGDYAAAVFKTALAADKLTIIYGEVKMSGTTGAWVPNIVGLFDAASEPSTYADQAARNAALRIWQEYQMSSGADQFDRIQLAMKNAPDGVKWNYVANTSTWTSTFTHTRAYYDEGSYYRFVIVFDGTTTPKRARSLVYGWTEAAGGGAWRLSYDSTWRDFDTGSGDIDPFDNSAWVIFGDSISAATRAAQIVFDFRRIMIGEIDTANVEEFAFSNRSSATGANFQYEILKRLNPMPDNQTLWIPRERQEFANYTAEISRGADAYVKDSHCFFDGTNYWLFYQRDNAGEGEIEVVSVTDILNGTWSAATVISQPDTGEDKHQFPWATKYGGTWYLFYGIENDDGTWEIQYKTTTATNPTSGWSSATTILTQGAATDWDEDGVDAPILIWHSGGFTDGVWYMVFAGVNGLVWKGGLAKSTTGITGPYTKDAGNPIFIPETFSTLVSGAHVDQMQITVDSTTGLNAGQILLATNAGAVYPQAQIEVISVDDATHFTGNIESDWSDNDPVQAYTSYSLGPRYLRRIGGYWLAYVTSVKFPGGEEAISVYVDTTGEAALEDCTFRELRYGDSPLDLVVPAWHLDMAADENFGGVWSELTPVVAGGATLLEIISETVDITELDQDDAILNILGAVKVIAETVNIGETINYLKSMVRLISETVNVDEAVLNPLALVRVLSETVNISENIARLKAMVRIISETINTNEAIQYLRGRIQIVNETVNIQETIVKLKAMTRVIDETVNIIEAALNPMAMTRVLAETVNLQETTPRLMSMTRPISETVNVQENIIRFMAMARQVAETVNIQEVTSRVVGFVRIIDEAVNINEAISYLRGRIRMIAETVNIQETILNPRVLVRLINETVNINEVIVRARTLVRLISEAVDINENVTHLKAMTRVINETVNIAETIVDVLVSGVTALIRVIDEVVDIQEARNHVLGFIRLISETVNVNETVVRLMAMTRAISETVNINETIVNPRVLVRFIAETVNINEAVIRARTMVRVLSETVDIGEAVNHLKAMTRVIDETVNIVENIVDVLVAGVTALIRVIDETVNIDDAISRLMSMTRVINEAVNINEVTPRVMALVRLVAETVNIVENVINARMMTRMVDEAVNIIESVQQVMGFVKVITESVNISETIVDIMAVFVGVIREVKFKGMFRGLFKRMR